jgi:hypothetical protein
VWWERGVWCGWEWADGTLLGPEGTTTVVVFLWTMKLPGMAWCRKPVLGEGLGVVLVVVGWSFVENCTVDASIFVVKLSRANGGCLGTRSR